LGLEDSFDAVVYAQEPEVGRFKPHPRMLQVALQRLGVAPRTRSVSVTVPMSMAPLPATPEFAIRA